MRDSTIFSNRSNRSSSVESADSARVGHDFRPGFGSGSGSGSDAALKIKDPRDIRGADGAVGAAGAEGTSGVGGAGSTAGCPTTAVAWPVFIFGPEPMAGGLGVADGAASLEAASPAPGETLAAADATAGVPWGGSSMRAPSDGIFAAAGAASLCASTILGAKQMAVTAKSAAADAMNASHVAASRG